MMLCALSENRTATPPPKHTPLTHTHTRTHTHTHSNSPSPDVQIALGVHKQNFPKARHVQAKLPIVNKQPSKRNVRLPVPRRRTWQMHSSPPCQALLQAPSNVPADKANTAIELVEYTLSLVVTHRPDSWSFEHVPHKGVRAALVRFKEERPDLCDFAVVDFADYGVAQNRRRLIAGNPPLIAAFLLKTDARPCIREILPHLPTGLHLMNHTTNTPLKGGGYRKLEPHEHMRSVEHDPAYTVMASAAHHWTDESGTKLRAVAVEEAAALQGFPPSFNMDGVTAVARRRGVGNAVPVEAARRLFEACVENM